MHKVHLFSAGEHDSRVSLIRLPIVLLFPTLLAVAQTVPASPETGPLIVDRNSHVVVMEYEKWFGPEAVTFQGAAAMPLLQSADMQRVGGGYDSADPAVGKRQLAWLESLGVDAALIEVTNAVSCIFNSEEFAKRYLSNCTPAFRLGNQIIRNNTGNTYPAWSQLGTRLKLIPLLGGVDQDVLYKDIDGKTAFEKEIEYFGALMDRYPELNIIYEGKLLNVGFCWCGAGPESNGQPIVAPDQRVHTCPPGARAQIHI